MRSRSKAWLNRALRPWNLRIESLAAEKADRARLAALVAAGQFDGPVFPVLEAFQRFDPMPVLRSLEIFSKETAEFLNPISPADFSYSNEYFTSPDAEVAYALVRSLKPKRIVEIGSGNSTRLFRAAIRAGGLGAELISIDPEPRQEVRGVADRVLALRLEEVDEDSLVASLGSGDFLFIDSSHKIEAGNDVVRLLLRILPALEPGVVLHLHDIFLPFEYPREWLVDLGWRWNEQYLVQAVLQGSQALEVLWPGHYLQRLRPDFQEHFAPPGVKRASSLWLRKVH